MSQDQLGDVTAAIETWYPIALADDWDQVGLSLGKLEQPVSTALLTVDITQDVLQQAVDIGAQLVLSHHPLHLTDLPEVVTEPHIANLIHFATRHNLAIYSAHTNADNAVDGVSDAILKALGGKALCSITNPDQMVGTGRVAEFDQPITVHEIANRILAVLPKNNAGVKVAGDINKLVSRIAICGGSGAGLLPQVAHLEVDAYLTADIKHHAALDHLANSDVAILNVSHWASEWLWLATLAEKLNREFPMIDTTVSQICTDPWNAQFGSGDDR